MVRRVPPVRSAASVSRLDTTVSRTEHDTRQNGLSVLAAEPELLTTVEGQLRTGSFLGPRTESLPVVVLGSVAADRLGIVELDGAPTVRIAGAPFAVGGVLEPLELHPDLDRSVFVGPTATRTLLGAEPHPSSIYVRSVPEHVQAVGEVLPRTVSPGAAEQVRVSRPSDALQARAQVDEGLRNLILGLGAVALLVGGIGIANVMIISVLERRTEIGLRRALGARRAHIAGQFLLESTTLAALGGVTGAGLGTAATAVYGVRQGWLIDVPASVLVGSTLAALVIGALAGLHPAVRAARLDPADSLRPTG